MMQYPNGYYNQPSSSSTCNTENCKKCCRKFSCQRYVTYLENIATSPVAVNTSTSTSPITPMSAEVDLTEVIQATEQVIKVTEKSNKETKDSLNQAMVNKFLIIETQNRLLQEAIEGLSDKFSKLDKLISMIDSYEAQNNPETGNLAVYNGESGSDSILVEKKGFFGLGKTKWVEEKIDKKPSKKIEKLNEKIEEISEVIDL